MLPFPQPSGALLLPGVLPQEACDHSLALIKQGYATLGAKALAATGDFSPHSSSLRLRALPQIPVGEVWAALRRHPEFLSAVQHALGPHIACLEDECWIRRQYAPGRYPPQHAPHSWHQDGALGFDFLAQGTQPPPADALLDLLTCWITLTDCGVDAPGLELISVRQTALQMPQDLTPEQVAARFPAAAHWRPAMNAGDALLFRGDVLHRTQVNAAMSRDRVSIELRWVAGSQGPRAESDLVVALPGHA